MNNFLTQQEIAVIKCDFETVIDSCEGTNITGFYVEGVPPEDPDIVYSVNDYASTVQKSITGRCLQEIVKVRHEELLKFGILESGDCILYTSISLNLNPSGMIDGSMYIKDPGGNEWTPIPRTDIKFQQHLIARLGDSQISQVIPCKLRKI